MTIRRGILPLFLGLAFTGIARLATAQHPAPYYYPPLHRSPGYTTITPQVPTLIMPPRHAYPRHAAPARPRAYHAIPYTRSPYTDDWSTDRRLPFPKPWMLPSR